MISGCRSFQDAAHRHKDDEPSFTGFDSVAVEGLTPERGKEGLRGGESEGNCKRVT